MTHLAEAGRGQGKRDEVVLIELLPQVEDDSILEVVDVLLIRVNSWGIHPLREATVVIIVGELKNSQKNINKPSMVDEHISFP